MNFADQFHDARGMNLLARVQDQPAHLLFKDAAYEFSRMMHRALLFRCR